MNPLVSVVLPTRNSGDVLEACLESIMNQSYSPIEIIVADNYSLDTTVELAAKYGKVIICGPKPPKNNFFTGPIQRKLGATYATGEFLFFIDSDMILPKKLVQECVEYSLKGANAVAVPERSFGNGFWSRCKILERICYFEYTDGGWNIQACRFIRKSAYLEVGGWDDSVGGFDDWSITARLLKGKFKIVRVQSRILHNEGRLTLRKIFMKKYMMGRCTSFSKYALSKGTNYGVIAFQLTPLRILLLVKILSRIDKKFSEICGVAFMKMLEGVGFSLGRFFKFSS